MITLPYDYPGQHWELDDEDHPTNGIMPGRRRTDLIRPIRKPTKKWGAKQKTEMLLDADVDLLISCAFNYGAHATEFAKLGRIPMLKVFAV